MLRTFLFFMTLFLSVSLSYDGFAKGKRVHPYNQILVKLYPRPFPLKWRSVRRILAREALNLYRTNKAIFVRIGVEGEVVPGALFGKHIEKIDPRKLSRIANGRVIITYCN